MKVVIIGGVAGGATAAARLRRESESAEIVILERGAYVSFANCGLPYFIGREITHREKLLLQTPEGFWDRYRIKVQTNAEVKNIDTKKKILNLVINGKTESMSYDKLLLSQGALPIKLPIPGAELPHVFSLRDMKDMDLIESFIEKNKPKSVLVAGAGFIGLELVEAFKHRGLTNVHLVEIGKTPMPMLDPEFGIEIEQELQVHGVVFHSGLGLQKIETEKCTLSNGKEISAQFVILAAGVRPELVLAKEAGISFGEQGGLAVNSFLQTSDPDIYGVGDMVEIHHRVLDKNVRVPLAGPANRQGRIAAMNILKGNKVEYKGALGSSVVKVFSKAAASTGLTENQVKRAGIPYKAIAIHGRDHAGYYPGATSLHLKLLFHSQNKKILGAEAFGTKGVEKRIDVIATALLGGLTIDDLSEVDLCYAPPFSSANDPVNMACFVAQNSISGFSPTVTAEEMFGELQKDPSVLILDVRKEEEFKSGHVDGAKLIPVDDLRIKLSELPRDKKILVHCQVGFRGHLAVRILQENGFKNVFNVTGGYRSIQLWQQYMNRI